MQGKFRLSLFVSFSPFVFSPWVSVTFPPSAPSSRRCQAITMTAFIGLGAMGKHMARHLTCRLVSPATSYCGGVEMPAAAAASSSPSRHQQQQQGAKLAPHSHPYPHPVRKCFVWNRSPDVAKEHAEHYGSIFCRDVREVAQADVIFSCLPTSVEVSSVVDKLLGSLRLRN